MCAKSARFGSPASATSPPATSVTVAGAFDGGAVIVGATGAADDELGAPATISATAPAPSRQIEAAIQGVAETGERMACQRGYGIQHGIPARPKLRK
jgi:hypothetical protein